VRQYGAGVAHWFGRTLRLGVDGNYYRRRTRNDLQREFEGFRIGASVSYGLPQ
jgi:hypothetical protein